ncbi:hypothetical protein DNU06_05140 [Putridiphycobacter roseus]|uniref:Uncharacterized protein n=1 Tax=Putridiphycobacter roseus TaxID=2219161 RepID=A0A2W1N2D8_9FLAO|nr:hypothetical protein [Putridiphycobacter roseus]PZE18004.1 hypothetical protein DNU06_05140 [Putridiphycobacter roseus]
MGLKYSFIYPFSHWLLTLIISPFIVMMVSDSPYLNNIGAVFIMMLFGLLYSLPTFIIYIIGFFIFKKYNINLFILKTSLIFTALIGMVLTILLLFDQDEFVFIVSYGIIINILGLMLPISRKKDLVKK